MNACWLAGWMATSAEAPPGDPDAVPLPRYVDADEILAVIAGRQAALAACVPPGSPDADTLVAFRVEPDGRFSSPAMIGGTGVPTVDACLLGEFGHMAGPAHDELPLNARYTVVVKGGTLVPFPIVELAEAERFPRFFYLPPDLDRATRQAVESKLGPTPRDRPPVVTEPGVDSGSGPTEPWTSTED
jgi:hypothetical protein